MNHKCIWISFLKATNKRLRKKGSTRISHLVTHLKNPFKWKTREAFLSKNWKEFLMSSFAKHFYMLSLRWKFHQLMCAKQREEKDQKKNSLCWLLVFHITRDFVYLCAAFHPSFATFLLQHCIIISLSDRSSVLVETLRDGKKIDKIFCCSFFIVYVNKHSQTTTVYAWFKSHHLHALL